MTSRVPLLACIAVLSFFAGVTGVRLAYTLAYILVGLLVVAFVWSRLVSRRLSVRRESPGGNYTVGQPFSERFTVRNGSVLPVPYCEVCDIAPLPGYAPGRAFALAGGETLAWRATGVFERRGRHRFGPLQARLGDPFGLFPQTVTVDAASEVLVYPTIHQLDAVPRADGARWEARRGRATDIPPDVSGIREHDPGDGLSRIHWASTARTGRLMSRHFDAERGGDLLVVLDLHREVHAGAPPESSLEYAVSVAASVCHAALRSGRIVGLAANDRSQTAIGGGRGEAQRLRLLDYLAVALDDGEVPLTEVIARHGPSLRGHGRVVVITARYEQSWVEELLDVGIRGERQLCILVDPTSFGAAGHSFRLSAADRLALDWWVLRRGDTIGSVRRDRAGAR